MLPVSKIQHALVTSRRRPGGPGDLGRLRIALCAVFAAHGFMFASWAVRVPAVKEQTGASSAALGLALLGYGGFLLGPPAIGFLASQAGLRTGLTTLSFLGLAAALIAWLSRDPPEPSSSASPHPGR